MACIQFRTLHGSIDSAFWDWIRSEFDNRPSHGKARRQRHGHPCARQRWKPGGYTDGEEIEGVHGLVLMLLYVNNGVLQDFMFDSRAAYCALTLIQHIIVTSGSLSVDGPDRIDVNKT